MMTVIGAIGPCARQLPPGQPGGSSAIHTESYGYCSRPPYQNCHHQCFFFWATAIVCSDP